MRAWRLLGSIAVVTSAAFFAVPAAPAQACGGGMVTEADANVAVTAQRVFVSTRAAGTTDIVAQLDVTGSKSYGVLIPLPSQPTLDTTPIDSKELDALDRATQVHLYSSEESYEPEDTGCSCGGDAAKDGGSFGGGVQNGLGDRGVSASEFVDIGPVSASVLQADTGASLASWLTDNGFSVAADDQSVIDSYVGTGKHFIVVKRADGAPAGRSSIGLHFTLQGDQRGYPLRMAQVGAARELSLSVYVSSEFGSAPTAPFQTLTLNNLAIDGVTDGEPEDQLAKNYARAIRAAVTERQGKAFVIEGVYAASDALASSPALFALTDAGHRLSRLTTIVDSTTLDTDVAFTAPAPENVPTDREVGANAPAPQGVKQAFSIFGLLLPALLGLTARRIRREPRA
ncbi:MAG: DUF2330 domain-containing protein [Polyangiaceae bacterium]|nr:DUF2330 domain-containing protein [Polyangiaceae bacterium]